MITFNDDLMTILMDFFTFYALIFENPSFLITMCWFRNKNGCSFISLLWKWL